MKKDPKNSSNKKQLSLYARYSGLAFQMVIIVVAMILGGRWLDQKVENETPWYTLAGAILGIFAALYYLFKEVRSNLD